MVHLVINMINYLYNQYQIEEKVVRAGFWGPFRTYKVKKYYGQLRHRSVPILKRLTHFFLGQVTIPKTLQLLKTRIKTGSDDHKKVSS